MRISKNDKKDEIDDQLAADNQMKAQTEAFYFASRPVSLLLQQTLKFKGQTFNFNNIAKEVAEIMIRIPGSNVVYHIYLDIVSKKHTIDLEPFKNAANFDYVKMQISKLFLYSEMIYDILRKSIEKDYPEIMDMKFKIDLDTTTCYIDEHFSKRIGIRIDKKYEKSPSEKVSSKSV